MPGKLLIRVVGWRALPPTSVSALLTLSPASTTKDGTAPETTPGLVGSLLWYPPVLCQCRFWIAI